MGYVTMSEDCYFQRVVEIPDDVIAEGKEAIIEYIWKKQDDVDPGYVFRWQDCYDSTGLTIKVIESKSPRAKKPVKRKVR